MFRFLPLPAWELLFGSLELLDRELSLPPRGALPLALPARRRIDYMSYWELLFATTDPEKRLYVRVEPFGGRVTWAALVGKLFELD